MATAYAHTNIALIKYWGKRGAPELNLPAVGSLSLTLDELGTETSVELAARDSFVLDGADVGGDDAARVFAFLDVVAGAGRPRAAVVSRNDVPTAAGLASSASAFCALAKAAVACFGIDGVDDRRLSMLARRGSGSAARSVFPGFVLWHRGERDDGEDSFAEPITGKLDVRLVVARCGTGKKATGSRAGMGHAQHTSPYFASWVSTHAADLSAAVACVHSGDLHTLGELMEHSTWKMHATTETARPPFFYRNGASLAAIHEVLALRARGVGAWATMDAGPHVKVLCATPDAPTVEAALAAVPGVVGARTCRPGPGARLVATAKGAQ